MEFQTAAQRHYPEIIKLVTSPEELFLISPKAQYPWDIHQLEAIAHQRLNLTVVLDQGVVVGFASLYDVEPNDIAFIGNVIVAAAYRGRGVGSALTEHMIKLCVFEHNAVPHISVFGINSRALLLYSSMGFKPYEIEARRYLDGQDTALIKMCYEPRVD